MELTNTKNQILTREQMEEKAPSIFTTHPWSALSDKYSYISTPSVIDMLENEGWFPVSAQQVSARVKERKGYQRHMIRFRSFREQIAQQLTVGDVFVELVLTNSYDGWYRLAFNAGLYRLACSNGMVVSQGSFQTMRLVHRGLEYPQVQRVCLNIVQKAPSLIGTINEMKQIEMTKKDTFQFAEEVKPLRFPKPELIDNELLLKPQRQADEDMTLWNTFNILQEKFLKGGTPYTMINKEGEEKTRTTRAVKGIDDSIKVNQGLWTAAGKFLGARKEA